MRVIRNILHCLKYGTQMGWLLSPKDRSIMVFHRDHQPIEMTGDEKLPVLDFLEIELTVAQVFGWLKIGKQP